MLNKFLIPAALIVIIAVTAIFAFMPAEKASTVHGSLTTTVDSEVNAQDRYLFFTKNYTLFDINSVPSTTLLSLSSSETVSVYAVVTATRNSASPAGGGGGMLECGVTLGADGSDITTNATMGSATAPDTGVSVRNGTATITNGADIMFGPDADSSTIGGVCSVMLLIDSSDT